MIKHHVAVIGTGFIGMTHIEALKRIASIEIVALCDKIKNKSAMELANVDKMYTDIDLLLEETPLNAIHVCTPNDTHYSISKKALEKNINVICEKPFTINLAEGKELCDLSAEKKLFTMVNFHNRFYPMVEYMRDKIQSEDWGETINVLGSYLQDWLLYQTDYSWRLHKNVSGDTRAVSDIGYHWLDLMEYITGKEIVEICANFSTVYEKRLKPSNPSGTFNSCISEDFVEIDIDTEDCATIMFKLNNGAIGNLILSQVFAGKKNDLSICIGGTKKSYSWKSTEPEKVLCGYRDRANEMHMKDISSLTKTQYNFIGYPAGHIEGFPDAFKQGFKNFYDSIDTEGAVKRYATFENGYRAMRLGEAIYRSACEKKWVSLD